MEAIRVQAALLARGTKLSPPASQAELRNLANVGKEETDRYILNIYSVFDGFESHDQKSQISIWSIDEIFRKIDLNSTIGSDAYVAFGDILVDSDFIMWCPSNANLPVYLLYERREIAISVSSFLEKLGAGAFDFVGSGN